MGKLLGEVKNPVLEHNYIFLESPFGERTYKGKKEQHNGIDLQYRFPSTKLSDNKVDNVISIYQGKVTKVGYSSTRGYYVEIKHNANYTSRYLHMVKNSIKVVKGQLVTKGCILGTEGMTGAADGVHVHLAILYKGKYVDPLPYLLGTLSFDEDWQVGDTAELLYDKFKRYEPCVGINKVPYDRLSEADKKKCKNVGGYAKAKKGSKYKLYQYCKDIKGNTWACTTNPAKGQTNKHWICIIDSTGDQAKKV